jgi:GTP diphosphokinase / guanosine-3',5'-bis(diphosphate) 3'-diphosphatase
MSEENLDLENRFNELISKVLEYNSKADVEKIKRAFDFAKVAHTGEKRVSGIDYVWHPLETAIILAEWKMDQSSIITGLIHDTVEHGAATLVDIEQSFGSEISQLVGGVTKVSKVKLKGRTEEVFVENLRKMFLAISKDLRIVFLRLAERLDNLKSLEYLPELRRTKYATESLEIYAPLAERLGMWQVKTKIDDLAFEYAYPAEYKNTLKLSEGAYKDAERRIVLMKKTLLKELNKQRVKAKILGRKKGLFSLWKKLTRPEINYDIEKLHDVVALRILVEEISDCYVALGSVHKFYKPMPHIPISDFISVPKPNGYRSIHTKVYGADSDSVEVQIRTFEMHREAEFGIAAHWAYSDAKKSGIQSNILEKGVTVPIKKLQWVKELSEWQKEMSDSEEFLQAVKFDALSRRIFVFSPKGDVYDLPEDATPIDFCYAVHTGLAKYIKGAKVNDKIVPLDYKLQNGQVVEILKHKEAKKPNKDWLNFAVTTMARREIKKSLNRNS